MDVERGRGRGAARGSQGSQRGSQRGSQGGPQGFRARSYGPGAADPDDADGRWWDDPDLEEPAFGTPAPRTPAGDHVRARPATGFDLHAWIEAPRHRDAPGVFAYDRDEADLRLREADERARTRPEPALVRRAVLWLLISLVAMRFAVPLYVWVLNHFIPQALWPLLVGNVFWILYIALFGWLGRWHELVGPYVMPYVHRMDRRADANGRPRPEQIRRAFFFLAVGFALWLLCQVPVVWVLLKVVPRDTLHDAQWLVRLVYNAAFLAGFGYLGRWVQVARPFLAKPTRTAPEQDAAPRAEEDLWPELRAARLDYAADRLDSEAAVGQLSDVDFLRLRHVMEAGRGDADYLAAIAEDVETNGAGACVHGSGRRDVRPRNSVHDLLTGQVRIGSATASERNPRVYRGLGFALEPDVLATSLIAVGPPGGGEAAAVLDPVVESMSLLALSGAASLIVIDSTGTRFARSGVYDAEVLLGDEHSPWGLDLYGAATPAEAADRLASAASPGGDDDAQAVGEREVLRHVLAAHRAAHDDYPSIGHLVDLLDGDPAAIGALRGALSANNGLGPHQRVLRGLEDDPAARRLARRLAVLTRPGVAELFDPGRSRFTMRDIDRPVRVRIALNEAEHPDAARVVGRLVVSQFVQAMAAPRSRRNVFTCLVADDAGRFVDAYAAQGLGWARSRDAALVLGARSMDDFEDGVRVRVFRDAGCKVVLPGAGHRDAEAFADHWGKTRVEETSVTRGAPNGGLMRKSRYAVMGALFGEKASGRSESVTVRTVERYRWSPSEISGDVPPRHALVSVTTAEGERTPPVLIELG